jgi:hypothetical protein
LIKKKWCEPYLNLGAKVTFREAYPTIIVSIANLGIGFDFWYKNFGVRLQTTGKLGLVGAIYTSNSNYVQHFFSILYRISSKTKKDNSSRKRDIIERIKTLN